MPPSTILRRPDVSSSPEKTKGNRKGRADSIHFLAQFAIDPTSRCRKLDSAALAPHDRHHSRVLRKPSIISSTFYPPHLPGGNTHEAFEPRPERSGDRAGCGAEADPRRCGVAGTRPRRPGPVRQVQGQDPPGCAGAVCRPAAGQVRRRDGDHADAAGRGQDDDDHRPDAGVGRAGQARGGGDPPAVAGADLRHQGRRGRRRLQPGGADGGLQPAPDRRHPRHHRGARPDRGGGRRPHAA